jgi:hypothetical protein
MQELLLLLLLWLRDRGRQVLVASRVLERLADALHACALHVVQEVDHAAVAEQHRSA